MLLNEIKNISSTKKDLKNFGIVIGSALVIIGGLLLWKERPAYPYFICGGLVFAAIGLVIPAILKPLQIVWMTFAVIMGFIMTRIILGIVFYLVMTPIGLVCRLMGKDLLNEKIDRSKNSYWIPKNTGVRESKFYERQF